MSGVNDTPHPSSCACSLCRCKRNTEEDWAGWLSQNVGDFVSGSPPDELRGCGVASDRSKNKPAHLPESGKDESGSGALNATEQQQRPDPAGNVPLSVSVMGLADLERWSESVDMAQIANGGAGRDWKLPYCSCDHSVGAAPCEYCAIYHALKLSKQWIALLRPADGNDEESTCEWALRAAVSGAEVAQQNLMNPQEAIKLLRGFQSQIVHGSNTFGDIADLVLRLEEDLIRARWLVRKSVDRGV